MISIVNPGADCTAPAWFDGERLVLSFGDVTSEADAINCKTAAPSIEAVHKAVEFARAAFENPESYLLLQCDYGASRSPAIGYVIVADKLGAGSEVYALQTIIDIRPASVPNNFVVKLGDRLLKRNGELLRPLKLLYDQIEQEMNIFA